MALSSMGRMIDFQSIETGSSPVRATMTILLSIILVGVIIYLLNILWNVMTFWTKR